MTVLTMSDAHIRRAQETEHAALVRLWERSVRATHDFLAEADIVHLRPLVAEYFAGSATDLWVLTDEKDVPIGFLGLAGDSIAALFMEPTHQGQGGGRRLVSHAQELWGGALTVGRDGRAQVSRPQGEGTSNRPAVPTHSTPSSARP